MVAAAAEHSSTLLPYDESFEEPAPPRRFYQRRSFQGGVIGLAVLGAVLIVVGLTVGNPSNAVDKLQQQQGGGGVDTSAPPAPSPAPTTLMQSRLASEIALFGGAEFNDPTSIQSRALAFLESLDNTLLVFNTTQLTQLYALSCFYFSTYNVFNGYDQSAWLDHQHWVQTDNVCNWFGVKCSPGEKVTSLQLPNNNVTGIVPLEMGLLTDLELLDLSNNAVANLNEEMAWMAQLTNLRELHLYYCNFDSDGIPTYIGRMTSLEYLDVSYTLMFGSFHGEDVFANLVHLQIAELGGNAYNESIPDALATLPKLENLYIENAQLTGNLDFISKMPVIWELWMDFNPNLQGSIPTSPIAATLQSWSVADCGLTGTIPTELGILTNMVQMWLYDNHLEGSIPTELLLMTQLTTLNLQGNPLLTGTMPLCTTAIEWNSLGADCPYGVDCACCTCCGSPCTDTVQGSTGGNVTVEGLIWRVTQGRGLSDPTSPQSQAVAWLTQTSNAELLDAVPQLLQRYALATLYYATYAQPNDYTNDTVTGWTHTDWLTSPEECSWTGIQCDAHGVVTAIDLNAKGLTGSVPLDIELLSLLRYLDLGSNAVVSAGEDMRWMKQLTHLTYLDVGFCNFDSDGLPPYLAALTNLNVLDISYTLIQGALDGNILGRLTNLVYLEMGGNSYHSSLPNEIKSLTNLQYLYAEYTDLTGDVSFLADMDEMVEFWADLNPRLTGSLPSLLPTTLKSLSLSACSLTGTLATELGRLTNMVQMWLYDNDLVGTVPSELVNMVNLTTMHLELNDFTGTMPICELRDQHVLTELAADCKLPKPDLFCDCCTCCEAPCTTSESNSVAQLLAKYGVEVDDLGPAHQAVSWLELDPGLAAYSDIKIVQRFALATMWYATNEVANDYVASNVPKWVHTEGWMSERDECSWHGIVCDENGMVKEIHLDYNKLTGSFPSEIELLASSLTLLDIGGNQVYSSDFEWLASLTNLVELDVHANFFDYDGVPPSMGALTKLEILDISYTLFFGALDGTIFLPLSSLNYVEMGGNSYNSSLPTELASLPELEFLYMEQSNLSGDLSFMKYLTKMVELWTDFNPDLIGSIPSEIGTVTTLKSLSMSDCGLTGTIPTEIGLLTNMQQMWIYNNTLKGTIPSELGSIVGLKHLHVEGNILSGEMPSGVCALRDSGLGHLAADCKEPNPEVLCECCTCCSVPCVVNNPVSGSGTIEDAGYNSTGRYQSQASLWIENDPALQSFSAEKILQRYALACVFLATNAISTPYTKSAFGDGPIPEWTESFGWLTDADECTWFGVECDENGFVIALRLAKNGLTGSFPDEVKSLGASLTHLDISDNLVSNSNEGLSWLASLTQLEFLNVYYCNFHYVGIPTYLSRLTKLRHLDLSYALFFGVVDGSIFSNMTQLEYLDMSGNSLGAFPVEIASLQSLKTLNLQNCDLKGDLSFVASMPVIQSVALDYNIMMASSIPASIGAATTLTSLSVGDCSLTGSLPSEIGVLTQLKALLIQNNTFTGTIPSSLGSLAGLMTFQTQGNMLTGEMPVEVCELRHMKGALTVLTTDCEVNCVCCTSKCQGGDDGSVAGSGDVLSDAGIEIKEDYQLLAATWLHKSAGYDSLPATALLQRFALACIYFATNGIPNGYTSSVFGDEEPIPEWVQADGWLTDSSECSWYGIQCDESGNVNSTDLSSNGLTGSFPQEVRYLQRTLKYLDLCGNFIHNENEGLTWIASLQELTYLDVHSNYFLYDGVPPVFPATLETLDISYTFFFGELSGAPFAGLTNLEHLEMGGNLYDSPLPADLIRLPRLKYLYAENTDLTGDLSFIGIMEAIVELWVDSNPSLGGSIPPSIGRATTLASFSVSSCSLTGTIPPELGLLTDMKQLWLFNNSLTGSIPDSMADMTVMNIFHIESNDLTGTMPAGVCSLRDVGQLTFLSSDCKFSETGEEPEVTCNCCTCCEAPCYGDFKVDVNTVLEKNNIDYSGVYQNLAYRWLQAHSLLLQTYTEAKVLQRFTLACFYYSTSKVQTTYTDATFGNETIPGWLNADGWITDADECSWYGVECDEGVVVKIQLANNGLTGSIPKEIKILSESLTHLDIAGNLVVNKNDDLAWIASLSNLHHFDFHGCNFEYNGIPPYLASLTSIEYLDISYTLLFGELNGSYFAPLTKLRHLAIGGNSYNGPIPTEIANLAIEKLYADNADITGDLSFAITMTSLVELWMGYNTQLQGGIPKSIGNLSLLAALSLPGCNLTGTIPTEIGMLSNLEKMLLNGNALVGSIPVEISNLSMLTSFHAEDNNLKGTMPMDVCSLRDLKGGKLSFLSADCLEPSPEVECLCCTCCKEDCSEEDATVVGSLASVLDKAGLRQSERYQQQATSWLNSTHNGFTQTLPEARMIQRYALACIYFSTNAVVSEYTKDEYGIAPPPGWTNETDWLVAENECSWYGITCNEHGLVEGIDLSYNDLTGTWPVEIQLIAPLLKHLDIGGNIIASAAEDMGWLQWLGSVTHLDIHHNNFAWDGIPPFIAANLSALEYLDISYTLFYGQLEGDDFVGLNKLSLLELGGNWYSGTVPTELVSLPVLERLYIENANLISDLSFFDFMSPSMFEFWIDINPNLEGTIPASIGNVTSLASLSITDTFISGELPTELGLLTDMQQMWLYNNSLVGPIPSEIGLLSRLSIFQVENNELTGSMPRDVCFLASLETLSSDCQGPGAPVECDCCSDCY